MRFGPPTWKLWGKPWTFKLRSKFYSSERVWLPKRPSWSAEDRQVDVLARFGSQKCSLGQPLGVQNEVLDGHWVSKLTSRIALGAHVDFWECSGPPTWTSGSALDVQVGVLGTLWASKLGFPGRFGQPNEAPKESFGPPKSVGRRLRMHFCNVMKNLEKPKENLGFC